MGTIKDLLARTLKPGAIIGGYYQLQRRLGQGGFGEVWAATDLDGNGPFALKLMPHQWTRLPEVAASLAQECVVLKTLAHPHICRVLDLVHDAIYGPLLVTELVEGVDCVAATRGAAPAICWRVVIQALAALSYLHSRGVLHLDIKPANVLVAAEGIKLIDFGLATVAAPKPGAGTLAYMAPERIRGEAVDGRADLYAVGVLCYQCLTGANPFQAPQPEAIRQKQLEWTPPPVSQVRADLPAWIDTIVAGLFAKNPADRYPSAKAVLNEFQLVLGDAAVHQAVGHTASQVFAAAAGQFIGRRAIIEPLRAMWEQAVEGTPAIHWVQIIGATGTGKSRLLRELKFTAQLAGCQTTWCDATADVTLATIRPIAEALATARAPLVLCLDDYDQWGNDPDAHGLAGLLATMRAHPHPPTPIWCVMSSSTPNALDSTRAITYTIEPFTAEELTAYVRAVAPMSATHLAGFVEKLRERTDGIPAKVGAFMQALVARGYFATESGQWDDRLFADVVIDVPEPMATGGVDVPVVDPETLLTLCRHDRATGHAGRALAQLIEYLQHRGEHRTATAAAQISDLAIEAAECALTIGRPQEALALIENRLGQCPKQRGLLLLWHGILLMAEREYAKADGPLQEALAWAQAHKDLGFALTVQNQIARRALFQKQYTQAVAGFRATRLAVRELSPATAGQIVNNELGHALLLTGQLRKAVSVLTDDIARCRMVGALRRGLRAQLWRAECWRALEKWRKAFADGEAVAKEAKQIQDLPLLAEARNFLGMVQCQQGASTGGLAAYEQALALAYSVHDLTTVAIVTTNIGLARLRLGEITKARHALETALAFLNQQAEATAIERAAVPARIGLAEMARQEARYADALQLLAMAEAIAKEHQLLSQYQFPIVLTRAEIARDQGELATAHQLGIGVEPFARSPTERTTWRAFMDSVEQQEATAKG